MKKLYISDLDGTLVGKDKVISEYTTRNINQLIKTSDITVATGRNIFTVYGLIKDLDFNIPLILCNGGVLYNKENDTFSNAQIIDKRYYNEIQAIIDNSEENPFIIGFDDDKHFLEYCDIDNYLYERFYNLAIQYNEDNISKVKKLKLNKDILEIIFYDIESKILNLKSKFDEKFGDKLTYECRLSSTKDGKDMWLLAIFATDVKKANMIKTLSKKLNYSLEDVVVFGDGINDIDMFQTSAKKVCVGNACQELVDLADVKIGKNTDDSVIKYILNDV